LQEFSQVIYTLVRPILSSICESPGILRLTGVIMLLTLG
jgi:hypothetical protein